MPRRRPNELRNTRARRGLRGRRERPPRPGAPAEPDVLRVLVAPTATAAQTLFLVNGEPVFGDDDREMLGFLPDEILAPGGGLHPADTPHRTYVACRSGCVPECCGVGVEVREVREVREVDHDAVVWRITPRPGRDSRAPYEARFEREQYLFALEWARFDRGWEWPGLRIARLLGDRLRRSRPLARIGCLDYTASSPRNRDEVRVKLHFEGPWMWPHGQAYHVVFPVTADDPAAQAEAMYDAITASDPRGRLIHTGVPDQTEYLRAWGSAQ